MPDRYQTLFGASRPALDPASLGPEWVEEGIFLRNAQTGERRLKQIPGGLRATTPVETPDTSLPAIAKEYLGLAGATAAVTNVGIARLPSLVARGADATSREIGRRLETLTPRGQQKQGKEADAYLKLFGSPAGRMTAEMIESQQRARAEQLDPLARTAEMTAEWEQAARERLAEATQDLPTPLAVRLHQGATMAGMLADPTLGAGASRAPRALLEAAQEAAIAAGGKPSLGARAEAALQRGYSKLHDLDEADALTRDMLNRNPGFREAYYGDRLDEVEVGLQRLREAEDAAPTPPYLRQGDRASQAPPAAGIAIHGGYPAEDVGALPLIFKVRGRAIPRLPERPGTYVVVEGAEEPALREELFKQWDFVSRRHPRLAANVRRVVVTDDLPNKVASFNGQDGVLKIRPGQVSNTGLWFHEITHAGQSPLVMSGNRGANRAAAAGAEAPAIQREATYAFTNPPASPTLVDPRKWSTENLESRIAVLRTLPETQPLQRGARQSQSLDAIRLRRELEVLENEEARRVIDLMKKTGTGWTEARRELASSRVGGNRGLIDLSEQSAEIAPDIRPPGPEARGAGASPPFRGQVASAGPGRSGTLLDPGAGASPPFRGNLSGADEYPAGAGKTSAEASPPLGPRPGSGEAGFIKLRPDPLSPADAAAKEAGWQMRKEYAATNRLGRYRAGAQAEELQRLIPKETDEALTWMFHGLGDPRNYANRPPRVQARIARKTAAQRRVIDQVLADPSAESALQEVAAWRERSKEMWDDLSEMWDLGFVKNYLHMTYEPPPGIRPGDAFRRASATPGMARQRTFMNPAEALAAGYTPRTLRFSQLRAETEKVFAHAQAVKGLVDDLGSMPLLQDGRAPLLYATTGKQPAGYVHVPEWARPVFDAAARRSTTSGRALPGAVKHAEALQAESRRAAETAGGFFRYTDEGRTVPSVLEQPGLPGTEGLGPRTFRPPRTPTTPDDLWVHPEIWKELKPVLDTAEPIAIDRFLGTVKRVKFLGSIFHPFELGLAAMQSMGPVKGAKAWASRGGGLPGLAQLAERRGWASPFTREVTEKWVRRGLGVEAPSADMMTDSFQRAMVGFEDAMQRAAGGPAGRLAQGAGAAGRGLRRVAGYYDEAIWGVLHSKIKIAAAEQWEAQIRAALAGDRRAMGVANRFLTGSTRGKLAAMSEEEIGEAVASAINNHFGGQVWELSRNALFSDPRALKWMRRIFLSPDWNVSAISSGLAPLSQDPVHRIIGRTYWTNISALAAGFAALNYTLTAGSEQGPHFPWQNEEGHKMDLETPFRTDKGRKIFYRVGKHAQELPHFAWGVPGAQQMKFILGKTAPIIHAAAGLAGESVTEYPSPYEELVRKRERTGETPGPVENLASRLQPSVEMMLPFSLQDAEDPGDVLRKLLISIPESKGMSTYKAENLYADALVEQAKAQEAGDAEGVAEAEARMEQIVTWLKQNGYDDEQINFMVNGAIRSGGAMGKAKRRLKAGR